MAEAGDGLIRLFYAINLSNTAFCPVSIHFCMAGWLLRQIGGRTV
jgi:hypothetical protein